MDLTTLQRYCSACDRHGPKIWGLCPFWGDGVRCGLGRGLPSHQLASWSIQPFGHNRHGPEIGGSAPFRRGRAGSPSNTMSLGPRPNSVRSGILIHLVIWPQQIWAENWGLCPFGGGKLGPHLTQYVQGRGLSACKVSSWSVEPFATIHQSYRQTDRQDRTTVR